LIAAIIVDTDWQRWPIVAIALFYGLAIMTIVIVTLIRSARMRHKGEEKRVALKAEGFPGRVTGERP
jgi:hypothetical protein